MSRRPAEPKATDGGIALLPLYLICILLGLILFVAGSRDPQAIQDTPMSAEPLWGP